jgi:hypothetical protein
MNKFGSAVVGKGKACREYRRLALISANELTAEEVPEATIGVFKVAPTSGKTFGEYVRSVAEVHKRPLWSVITTLTVMPDPVRQISVSFKPAAHLTQEVATAVRARENAVNEILFAPYPVIVEEPKPVKPAGNAKFAVRK